MTPELGEWGWGAISNCDTIDTLRERMMDIIDNPSKVLNENFMMNMFHKYVYSLPPFMENWGHLFQKMRMVLVASESGAKVLRFNELRKELFSPSESRQILLPMIILFNLQRWLHKQFLTSCMMKKSNLEVFVRFRISCLLSRLLEGGSGGIAWL
jgi:hypothetical protein